MFLSSDAAILQLSPIMANWFMSVSSRISKSEIFENISPYKYWKGFLSVKLRENSNQIYQTKSSQRLWYSTNTVALVCFYSFIIHHFKEILWTYPSELFMNLQGEPPSHKHRNCWEGKRDPCKGSNHLTAKTKGEKWDLKEYWAT